MQRPYIYPEPPKKKIFSSLGIPNFRLYIIGHFVSMIGVWMQIVAISWLVWRLTHSGDWLGAAGFASRFLTFALGLIGGAIADKIFRKNLIVVTQVLSLFQASILAVLTYLEIITPEIIIGLILFLGAVYAFDFPARQSFIADLVGKTEVDNAIALSSSAVHAARVIGPSIAGIIVAYWGESACFFINAVTYLALIGAILLMDKSKLHLQPTHKLPMYKAIMEGLITAWKTKKLRYPLILLSLLSFFGMPYYILIPIFVDKVYQGDSKQYGLLMAASAVGALAGALIMAKHSGKNKLIQNMKYAPFGLSFSLITFSLVSKFWMGSVVMITLGIFALLSLASINAWLQKNAPDQIRGRIMSLYTMMFFGVVPFGTLVAGFMAERISAPTTLLIYGTAALICSFWFILTVHKKTKEN